MEQTEDLQVTSDSSNSEQPDLTLVSRMIGSRDEPEILINGQKIKKGFMVKLNQSLSCLIQYKSGGFFSPDTVALTLGGIA